MTKKKEDAKLDGGPERRETYTTSLECQLTPDELREAGKKLADAISRKKRVEEELESFKAQKKGEITSCEGEISVYSEKVNREKEFRMIDCETTFDWKLGKKTSRRLDTNVVVRVDTISDHERQEQLKLIPSEEKEAMHA